MRMPSFRSFVWESPYAIPQLLGSLMILGSLQDHPYLQEDLITTLLNLSKHENKKNLITSHPVVFPLLIKSLKYGILEMRSNAPTALFSLSALDESKLLIGESGDLKDLIDLLEQGFEPAMKDVTFAIFNQCKRKGNRGRLFRDGAVRVILDKITEKVHVSELLITLALLSTHQVLLIS